MLLYSPSRSKSGRFVLCHSSSWTMTAEASSVGLGLVKTRQMNGQRLSASFKQASFTFESGGGFPAESGSACLMNV